MKIKLPENIQEQFFFIKELRIQGVKSEKITPRNLLNFIERNNKVIEFENLYKYLFDSEGCQQNQLKFLNAFYGQKYEFQDEKFKYFTKQGLLIGYNYFGSRFVIQANEMNSDVLTFTRDEILDSPFDINKLKEVPLDETDSNDSNN